MCLSISRLSLFVAFLCALSASCDFKGNAPSGFQPFYGKGFVLYVDPNIQVSKECIIDFKLLKFSYKDKVIMSAYVGNQPDVKKTFSEFNPNETSINGLPRIYFKSEGREEWLVDLGKYDFFPNYIHFSYDLKNKELAKKIIHSIRESFETETIRCDKEPSMAPLIQATLKNRIDIIREILSKDSDANVTYLNQTPLYYAVRSNNMKIAKYFLREKKVDVNLHGEGEKNNGTPLHAVGGAGGTKDMATLLIKNGAKIDIKNSAGFTPLMVAVQNLNLEVIKNLLDHEANPKSQDKEGNTPLHHLVFSKYGNSSIKLKIAELLVKSGANIHSRNQGGMTALEIAKKNNLKKLVSFLREN